MCRPRRGTSNAGTRGAPDTGVDDGNQTALFYVTFSFTRIRSRLSPLCGHVATTTTPWVRSRPLPLRWLGHDQPLCGLGHDPHRYLVQEGTATLTTVWVRSQPSLIFGIGHDQFCGVGVETGVGVGRNRPFWLESESELESVKLNRLRLRPGVPD